MKSALQLKDTRPSGPDVSTLDLIDRIPAFSGLVAKVAGTNQAFIRLAQLHQHLSEVSKTANSVSMVTSITMSVVDFTRIPLLFFAAYLVNEKLPFTLSHKAEWLYSAFLLGLTITALAAPITAPPIAFVFVSLGLGVSLVTLVKSLYQRHNLHAKLDTINKEFDVLRAIIDEAEKLQNRLSDLLNNVSQDELQNTLNDDLKNTLKKLDALDLQFNKKLGELGDQGLQDLHNIKYEYEEKLKQHDLRAVGFKLIGVVLSGLAVIGLVLCLFAPPVGLAILAASSLTGLVFMVGQLTFPFLKSFMTSKRDSNGKAANASCEVDGSKEGISPSNVSVPGSGPESAQPKTEVDGVPSKGPVSSLNIDETPHPDGEGERRSLGP
jgi:hypothetical protein